jgi:mRNA interferase MazF
MGVVTPGRFQVFLVELDLTVGSEIQKTRPCVIISPDEMNRHLRTVLIAPLTSAQRPYPSRVATVFQGREGQIALDQIRAVDRQRLVKSMGSVDEATAERLASTLVRMFAV